MIELTEHQQRVLREAHELPRAVIPGTGEVFVLVPERTYQRLSEVLGDDSDSPQVGMLVEETMREYDVDDPLLETYQRYRA